MQSRPRWPCCSAGSGSSKKRFGGAAQKKNHEFQHVGDGALAKLRVSFAQVAEADELERTVLKCIADRTDHISAGVQLSYWQGALIERYQKALVGQRRECNAHRAVLCAGAGASTDADRLLWNKQRLDRILVDHLLREGCYETAAQLAQISSIEGLVRTYQTEIRKYLPEFTRGPRISNPLRWAPRRV